MARPTVIFQLLVAEKSGTRASSLQTTGRLFYGASDDLVGGMEWLLQHDKVIKQLFHLPRVFFRRMDVRSGTAGVVRIRVLT